MVRTGSSPHSALCTLHSSLRSPDLRHNRFGHLGGGVGILVIAPLIPNLVASLGTTTGPIVIFVIIAAFLIVAAIIAQFGIATRQKRLDEVSP